MLTIWWRVPWRSDMVIAWFVDERWVRFISFILAFLFSSIGMTYYIRQKRKQKVLKINRGGVDLVDCIEPNKVYEIIDTGLQHAVRLMLGNIKDLILVEPSLAILASFLVNEVKFQIPNLGLTVAINNLKDTTLTMFVSAVSGVLSGSLSSYLSLTLLTTNTGLAFLLFLGIGGGAFFGSNKLLNAKQCKNFVQEIPMVEIVLKEEESFKVPIVDISNLENPNRVFIDGTFEQTIYSREQKLTDCTSEQQRSNFLLRGRNPDLKKKPAIHQKCQVENKYVPLKERTKTLQDLKRHDDTYLYEKAQPSINRYQEKVERLKAQRQRINQNRNRNNEL